MARRVAKAPPIPIPNELDQPVVPTETLAMQSPSGEETQVPADQAGTLAALGYKQITPELTAAQAEKAQYGQGIVNELEAAGLGILRGSSLGLSDLALRKINPEWADSAAKLKQYNPDASLAGEIGSFALPGALGLLGKGGEIAGKGAGLLQGLVSGGGSGLSKIATKIVGENLAGHALGGALNMAAQSAVYQAAHNLSEDALGDKDLTAESILAHTGQAAILGAGIGAALPIAARAAQEVAQSAPVRYAVSGAAKQFAKFFDPDRSLQLFTGAMKKELNAEKGKRFQMAVDELAHDSGASLYSSGEVALDPLTAKIVKTASGPLPDQAGAYERVLSIKKQAGNLMGETLDKADAAAAAAGLEPGAGTLGVAEAKAVGDKIENFRKSLQISDATAQRIQNETNEIVRGINGATTLKDLHQMRQGLDERVGGKNWEALASEEIEVVKDLRRILSKKIDSGIGELAKDGLIPKDSVEIWQRSNRLLSNLYTIEKPLADAISRAESNVNVFGLRFRDIGIGAIGGGVLGGPAGIALGFANKALQTDTGLLARAAIGEKMQKLAWAEQLMNKTQSEIATSIKGFLSGGSASGAVKRGLEKYGAPLAYAATERREPGSRVKTQQDWFSETQKQILAVASNPEAFAAHQGNEAQPLANAAPNVADAIIGKQLQVYAYLAQAMPKNPGMPTNIFTDSWKPADYEVQRFRKVVQVARAPLTILDDLHAGTITADQVNAVKELYPRLYESILTKVREEITAPDVRATYAQRLKLGAMFQGTEPTMAPDFVAAMQNPASSPDKAKPMKPPGGSVKLSKNYQTSTERAANR
jgi:hypothetical protein